MKSARLWQIIACFVAVFTLGGVSGWLLKPAPPAAPASLTAPAAPTSDRVLAGLDSRLKLSAEQKTKLAPLLTAWERELPPRGQNPRQRQQLFNKYAPLVREALTPEQIPAYDKMVEENKKVMERRLR